jgi:hypothetical protein
MRILAGLKESLMSAAEFVTARISRDQTEILVEFVVDAAPPGVGSDALKYGKA